MEPPNNGHIGSGRGLCPLLGGVLISEGAIELYLTAILSYNIKVISTQTAIIACYIIIVISVIAILNIFYIK